MPRIHRTLPPKGTRIGIAFSGGLDTRTAVAWMSRQGLDVFAYTADLAQPGRTAKCGEDAVTELVGVEHGHRVTACQEQNIF